MQEKTGKNLPTLIHAKHVHTNVHTRKFQQHKIHLLLIHAHTAIAVWQLWRYGKEANILMEGILTEKKWIFCSNIYIVCACYSVCTLLHGCTFTSVLLCICANVMGRLLSIHHSTSAHKYMCTHRHMHIFGDLHICMCTLLVVHPPRFVHFYMWTPLHVHTYTCALPNVYTFVHEHFWMYYLLHVHSPRCLNLCCAPSGICTHMHVHPSWCVHVWMCTLLGMHASTFRFWMCRPLFFLILLCTLLYMHTYACAPFLMCTCLDVHT